MQRSTRIKLGLASAVLVAGLAGGAVAIAGGGESDEPDTEEREAPITGSALDRAKAAALDHVGEGRVTETEVGDEESKYEVEVTKDDGSAVDVQLDEKFNVVGSEADEAGDSE